MQRRGFVNRLRSLSQGANKFGNTRSHGSRDWMSLKTVKMAGRVSITSSLLFHCRKRSAAPTVLDWSLRKRMATIVNMLKTKTKIRHSEKSKNEKQEQLFYRNLPFNVDACDWLGVNHRWCWSRWTQEVTYLGCEWSLPFNMGKSIRCLFWTQGDTNYKAYILGLGSSVVDSFSWRILRFSRFISALTPRKYIPWKTRHKNTQYLFLVLSCHFIFHCFDCSCSVIKFHFTSVWFPSKHFVYQCVCELY
jgi:hypothetical protein